MDKYEYLKGEEILFHDQRRVIEQAAFAYSPLRQAFERKKTEKLKAKEKTSSSFKSLNRRRRTRINWRNFSTKYEN